MAGTVGPIKDKILMGPGPSNASPQVLAALSQPVIGHLDPDFLALMDETQSMLKKVFMTANRLTLPVSGTGSAGMEACVVNLLEPQDTMVVCVNGVFGSRMVDVASRTGAVVHAVQKPWGDVFSLDEIEDSLRKHRPKVLGIVHAETSTGASQPMDGLGDLCHRYNTLLLVDCVTSLAGTPVRIDDWKVDAAYSGTQKCLSAPPGLAPVTFSDRAAAAIRSRRTKVQSWYLDMTMVEKYWGQDRVYHHTAPISMNYALHAALKEVMEEGLEARWQRHQRVHEYLVGKVRDLGLRFTAREGFRLPQLNAVAVPEGVDDTAVRKALLGEHGIEIGAGLGEFRGKVWRIGLMGHTCREANVDRLVSALRQLI